MSDRALAQPPIGHLAVDASRLAHDRRGMGRYVRQLLHAMSLQHPTLRVTLHAPSASLTECLAIARTAAPAWVGTLAAEPLDALAGTAADVAWYPWNFIDVPAARAPMVVTVHDIAPMLPLDGRWWKALTRRRFAARYRHTVQQAEAILSVSAFTAAELRTHLGVPASRVHVTPNAADDLPIDTPDDPALLARLAPLGPFFLSVGGRDRRKNVGAIDAAMTALHAEGVPVHLVHCGPGEARRSAVPWRTELGYVSDAELVTLYRHALALVFPSRYEGFGLPVLEAMRCGCPVIAGAGSALAEITNGAACLVAWDDVRGLTDAMRRLAADSPERERLTERGRARSRSYAWQTTARRTLDVFSAVVR